MKTDLSPKVESNHQKSWKDYRHELTSSAWTILLPLLTLLLHYYLWNHLPNAALGHVDPKVLAMPHTANEISFSYCRIILICTMIVGTVVANNLFKDKSQSKKSIVKRVAAASAMLCLTPAILMLYQVNQTFELLPIWAAELVEKGSYPSTRYPLFESYWYNTMFLLSPLMTVIVVVAIIIVSSKSTDPRIEED